jgi:hypothetical protein
MSRVNSGKSDQDGIVADISNDLTLLPALIEDHLPAPKMQAAKFRVLALFSRAPALLQHLGGYFRSRAIIRRRYPRHLSHSHADQNVARLLFSAKGYY